MTWLRRSNSGDWGINVVLRCRKISRRLHTSPLLRVASHRGSFLIRNCAVPSQHPRSELNPVDAVEIKQFVIGFGRKAIYNTLVRSS